MRGRYRWYDAFALVSLCAAGFLLGRWSGEREREQERQLLEEARRLREQRNTLAELIRSAREREAAANAEALEVLEEIRRHERELGR